MRKYTYTCDGTLVRLFDEDGCFINAANVRELAQELAERESDDAECEVRPR